MRALTIVGILYLLSGSWCLISPDLAGEFVGFGMDSAMAQAEYFTVYGGLQTGLGIAMIIASKSNALFAGTLMMALVISWSLFIARATSFMLYPEVLSFTGVIFMAGLELGLALALGIEYVRTPSLK